MKREARDLLSAAWTRNTSDQYVSAWPKWTSWCAERKVNPISASLSDIVNFLAGEYQQGKQYWTLNVYRSAISMTHPVIDSHGVGEHPMICQLLKGIFNSRPLQPRYSFIWMSLSLLVISKLFWCEFNLVPYGFGYAFSFSFC